MSNDVVTVIKRSSVQTDVTTIGVRERIQQGFHRRRRKGIHRHRFPDRIESKFIQVRS